MRRMVMVSGCVLAMVALGVALHQTAEPLPTWSVVEESNGIDLMFPDFAFDNRIVLYNVNNKCVGLDVSSGKTLFRSELLGGVPLPGDPLPYHSEGQGLLTAEQTGVYWADLHTGAKRSIPLVSGDKVYLSPDGLRLAQVQLGFGGKCCRVWFYSWDQEPFAIWFPCNQRSEDLLYWAEDGEHVVLSGDGVSIYHVPTRRCITALPIDMDRVVYMPSVRHLWGIRRGEWYPEIWDLNDSAVPRRVLNEEETIDTIYPLSGTEIALYRTDLRRNIHLLEGWDLATGKPLYPPGRFPAPPASVDYLPRRSLLLVTFQAHPSCVVDCRGGQEVPLSTFCPEKLRFRSGPFTPDMGPAIEAKLTRWGLPVAWVRSHTSDRFRRVGFLLSDHPERMWLFDTSGEIFEFTQSLLEQMLAWWEKTPGRMAVLQCQQRDPPRTLFRKAFPEGIFILVARSGLFIVTFVPEGDHMRISRYDLDSPKPWARIVGVPLGLGLVLLMLYALLRWWRRPR